MQTKHHTGLERKTHEPCFIYRKRESATDASVFSSKATIITTAHLQTQTQQQLRWPTTMKSLRSMAGNMERAADCPLVLQHTDTKKPLLTNLAIVLPQVVTWNISKTTCNTEHRVHRVGYSRRESTTPQTMGYLSAFSTC